MIPQNQEQVVVTRGYATCPKCKDTIRAEATYSLKEDIEMQQGQKIDPIPVETHFTARLQEVKTLPHQCGKVFR